MFPWTTATRTGSPCESAAKRAGARFPTTRSSAISTTATAARIHLAPAAVENDSGYRSAVNASSARKPVHADDARRLRDRQQRHLAVAEQRPRESVPRVLPPQLRRHPDDGSEQQRRRPQVRRAAAPRSARRQRERAPDRRPASPRRRRRPASRSPPNVVIVSTSHRACRRNRPRPARKPRRNARRTAMRARTRDDERCERDPGERGMAELREAQREQRAREER